MRLSIVTTLYHSEKFIEELCRRSAAIARTLSDDFEIVLVDDGSPDRSHSVASVLAKSDPHIHLIQLSRNFGHHAAILAGLQQSTGDLIFLIDSDMEEPPELLESFYHTMTTEDADVVYGIQAGSRRGGLVERFLGSMFYRLFNLLSDTPIPQNLCTIRLMKRNYVQALLQMGDSNLFLGGQFSWLGFHQIPFPIEKQNIRTQSTYSLAKKVSLFVNALCSFSSYPIRLVFYLGTILFIPSLGFATYLVLRKLFFPNEVLSGWSSIMASIWLLGSLMILFLGVIGMYIAKIFIEVKGRPLFVVRSHTNISRNDTPQTPQKH